MNKKINSQKNNNFLLKEINVSKKEKMIQNILSKSSINSVSLKQEVVNKHRNYFSLELPNLIATNQYATGRCWLFAATNLLRHEIAKKLDLKNFELSQGYLAFWDKLEKSNFLLSSIIELSSKPYDDRLLSFLLKTGVQDGGQWGMIVNIVNKYGIVPKDVMPDNVQIANTHRLNYLLNWKIRNFANDVKKINSYDEKIKLKNKTISEITYFLTANYGPIPTKFDFEYEVVRNTDSEIINSFTQKKQYHIIKNLTPQLFYEKFVDNKLEDYVSIINAPSRYKPFNRRYSFDWLNNVVDGEPIIHYNLDLSIFKHLIFSSLQNNEYVWFGADTHYYLSSRSSCFDDQAFDYDSLFDVNFDMNKGDMLDYRSSAMNHAMVINGVNYDNNAFNLNWSKIKTIKTIDDLKKIYKEIKINRWKIENSWGVEFGNNGYCLMSDTWFDKFVYQAVVKKDLFSRIIKQFNITGFDKKPIILDPWDPIGTLA